MKKKKGRKKKNPTSTSMVKKKENPSMIKIEVARTRTGRKTTKVQSLLIRKSPEILKVIEKVILNMVIRTSKEPKIKKVNLKLRRKNVIVMKKINLGNQAVAPLGLG